MEFLPYPFEHWNSYLILLNFGIPTLSFYTLEFVRYFFEHWNSYLLLLKIGIPTLSF